MTYPTLLLSIVSVLVTVSLSASLDAQDASKRKAPQRADEPAKSGRTGNKPPRKMLTAEQVAEVHAFVGQHMPELNELLQVLKENQQNRYAVAVRELHFAVDRLSRMEQKDAESYRMALRSWQLDKKAQLLAVRARMHSTEDVADELRSLLTERFELELQIRKRNRDKVAARLEKLDEDLDRFEAQQSEAIEKQIREWTQGKGRGAKSLKTRAKPKIAPNDG